MDDLTAAYLGEWRNDGHKAEQPSGGAELVSASGGARDPPDDANGSSDRNVEIDENGTKNGTNDGNENAGKRAHDADSDGTKGEDSTRKKQKTSDLPNEDNNDDGSEEDEHFHSEVDKCNVDRVCKCSLDAHDHYIRYEKSSIYGGDDKCFSWRLLSSKCTTLTATLEEFASQAAVQETVIPLNNCYVSGHIRLELEKTPVMPLAAALAVHHLKDCRFMLKDKSEFSKVTILKRRHAITRSCLNQWCDNYSHCHLVHNKAERDECLKRLQRALQRDALDKLPSQCSKHDPPCTFKLSRGMEQDVTTMWAQAHGVKSFSTCDKRLLGKWTLPVVQDKSQHVTLNGEKFPELPTDYAQPRDLEVTLDGLERGLTLREVIEESKGK